MSFLVSGWFGLTLRDILLNNTAVDLGADTFKMALYTNSLTTPNYATATAYGVAPFNTNELTNGAGYTTGGVVIGSPSVAVVGQRTVFDGNNAAWAGLTKTGIRGGLIYDDTIAAPVADPGIIGMTFGADFDVTAGTLTVVFHADGIGYAAF